MKLTDHLPLKVCSITYPYVILDKNSHLPTGAVITMVTEISELLKNTEKSDMVHIRDSYNEDYLL